MIVGKREETQFKIKLPVFKKKMFVFMQQFCDRYWVLLLPSLNESKNSQIFMRSTQIYLEQNSLDRLHLTLLRLF